MSTKEIKVPDIGDAKDVEVIEVLVSEGDSVNKEDSLIVVESDKATMEIPSSGAGKIKELKVKVGDKVSEGTLILIVEESGGSDKDKDDGKDKAKENDEKKSKDEEKQDKSDKDDKEEKKKTADSKPKGEGKEETVKVPDIGDAKDVEVIEINVKEGDSVEKDDTLIVVEGEKATMEIPAPFAGTVKSIALKVGDKVSQGSTIGVMKSEADSEEEKSGQAEEAKDKDQDKTEAKSGAHQSDFAAEGRGTVLHAPMPIEPGRDAPVPDYPLQRKGGDGKALHASPAIRRFARELGVNLEKITATGPKGRILKEDVQSFVKFELNRPKPTTSAAGAAPELPTIDYSKWGEIETTSLTRIQKVSSVNLHRNWITIPHVTQHEDADITEMENFRQSLKSEAEKKGIKLTPLVFVMKALVNTLKAFPTFNASLSNDGETLVLKKYWHIGIAVDTPDGLVVPVVKDVDKKSLFDLSEELAEISKKARDKKLGVDAMQGSTFTISSLGGIGGTYFTPIVAWPNVAILGLSRNTMKPVWDGKEFKPRLMLPMSLSYDHRVIDGAVGARFITHLGANLNDIRRLLL